MNSRILSLGIVLFVVVAAAGGIPAARAESGDSISGRVYVDKDLDGQRDAGEPAATGRKIELRQYLDEPPYEILVDTGLTDGRGAYTLKGVVPGARYWVSIHTDRDTPCRNKDSFDYPPQEGETLDPDFGVLEKGTGSISGSIIDDRDEDGVRDAGEPGYEGWQVGLSPEYNDAIGMYCDFSDMTDYSGRFGFTGLPLLPYRVDYWPESGLPFEITSPVERYEPAFSPHSPLVDLRDHAQALDVDILAHFIDGTSTVRGIAFRDINLNTVRDEGDDILNCAVYRDVIGVYRETAVGTLMINNAWVSCEDAEFTLSGVAGGNYSVQFYSWCTGPNAPLYGGGDGPIRSVTVVDEQQAQPVEMNMCPQAQAWFPGPESTPTPTATPGPVIIPPPLGAGPGEAASARSGVTMLAIALLTAAGAVPLAYAVRRRARRF